MDGVFFGFADAHRFVAFRLTLFLALFWMWGFLGFADAFALWPMVFFGFFFFRVEENTLFVDDSVWS